MAQTIAEAAQEIEEDFALFDDFRDKIEHIIDLGKGLAPMPDELKTEGSKVRGCQSQVWLVALPSPDSDRLKLLADSDAFVVKGLIALLLRLYDGHTAREILDNPPDVLERIGLAKLLTPGRANGLYSMVQRLQALAGAMNTAGTA